MSLELQIHAAGPRLSIKAVGPYSLANLQELFDRVKEEGEKCGCRRVILDLTGVTGDIPVIDMLVLGEHCARVWKSALNIAIVSPEGGLDKFFENVGQNRGVQLAVVPNQAAAVKWLK